MIETEDWSVILDQWDGLYTARDSDDIGDSYSPNVLNVRVNGSHFRGAKGYSLCGQRNASLGEITAQFTYTKNNGTSVMVRVRDDTSTGTLEWYDATNLKWYTLLASLTTGKRMGFAEFNTSSADQLIFCNGVQNMSVWTGSTCRLTQALAGGEVTINVDDTSDFPTTGTIIYNGTEIAYTAKTATTFTVASAHASDGADDGVAQAADDSTHAAITKGNILVSAKDRLWIAGQPDAESAVDYSDEGAALTFTGGANRTDSGTEDVLNIGGRITGIAEKGDEMVFIGPDGAVGFSFVYPTSTTKAPQYREIFFSPGRGATTPQSVIKVDGDILYANKNGVESISDHEGGQKLVNNSITRNILPTLQGYDFSEAVMIFFPKESIVLLACKTDPDSAFNDVVVGMEIYNDKDGSARIGFTRFDWPVNAMAILADELYFGSSAEMNSMKGFDTYQNDGGPRTIRYATKRYSLKDPFQRKVSSKVAVRGYIKDGTNIDVLISANGGFMGEIEKTIESTGQYVSSSTLNTLGAFALGTNPIGATIDEVGDLKEFMVYLSVGSDYRMSDISLLFSSDTDGGTYIITHVGFALEPEGVSAPDYLLI